VYKKIIILIFYFISFSLLGVKAIELEENSVSNSKKLDHNIGKRVALSHCPNNITQSISAGCEASVTWSEPTSDNLLRYVESTHNSGDIFPIGKTTVTYVERNLGGDTTDICIFIVNVVPEASYALSNCPGDIVSTPTESCDRRQLWFEPDAACDLELISNYNPGDEFPIGTTTVNYTAFKDGTIYGSCSFTVTLNDNFPPVFDFCPANMTLDANENCEAVANWSIPTASDNCGFEPDLTTNFANGSTFPIGTTTVTYTATDDGGNEAFCSFDVTVVDNTGPEFTNIPTEVRISANENCKAVATWDGIIAEDNCSSTISVNGSFNSGDVFDLGVTTVEYSAEDEAGNISNATFDVIVEDNTAPVVSNCPSNITISTINNCEATVSWDVPSFTDNCDNSPQVISTHNPGDIFPKGNTLVSYTATDDAGNETICSFTVSVEDNTSPAIVSPLNNVVVSAGVDACEAIVNWNEISAEDNCDNAVDIVSTHNSGDVFPLGQTTVEITATDDSGNETSASFLVTVEDQTAPQVLTTPNNITVSSSNNCDAIVNWDIPTFSDNCDTSIDLSSSHNSGDNFPIGTTTITYTATDNAANETVISFDVTVVDETAPEFVSCVSDIELTSNNQCQAVATWSLPDVSDNCNGEITLESDFNSGDIFPIGSTTVTYTATDQAGNSSNCSFEVNVIDNTPPTIISQLNDLEVSADEDACEAIVNWNEIRAEDNCDNDVQISSNFNSGDIFLLGESTVQITATDNAGNESSASFKVIVNDNTAPSMVSCPNDVIVSAKGNCESIANWDLPEFSDNCDTDLSITSSHNPRDMFTLGTTLVTYTATDDAGNERSCSFNVIVEDDKTPVFTACIPDIKLTSDNNCEAIAEWSAPVVTDNCDSNIALEGDFTSGDVFPLGSTTVTYTATDDAGNSSSCSFEVLVEDNSDPVLRSCPASVKLEANENCIGIAKWEEPVFEDCSTLNISSNFELGDELPMGTTLIEYTATDANGATSVCTFEVEVVDQSSPVVENCPEDINISLSEVCETSVEWDAPNALDNCSEVSIRSNYESGSTFPIGITTVEYEFTDEGGNTSFCSFEVNVIDESPIVAEDCPEDIVIKAENNEGTATVSWDEPTATAECSEINVNKSHEPGSTFQVGTTTVTYSFIKDNHQSVNCTFEVTVEPIVLEIEFSKLLTPNGDGDNDLWKIEGIEQFPDNQVIIVDRWGAEIFSATGYNNNEVVWSGENKNGELVPRGTYYYFISVRNEQEAIEKKGFLEILR